MDESLPTNYDLIVIGTGLMESIVGAAAARIGKQVLHLDHRDYYGSNWGSFSFSALQNFIAKNSSEKPKASQDDTCSFKLNYERDNIINIKEEWFVSDLAVPSDTQSVEMSEPSSPPATATTQWTKAEIVKNSRKFNLDLSPKILYSRGQMVDLLISSGICRYAEFRNVSKIYTYNPIEKRIIPVPCSRADVFSSTELSMVEKRMLMKILTLCADYEKDPKLFEDYTSSTFGQFLDSKEIHGKVRQYLMDTVAMAVNSTSFITGVENVQKFIQSIGRYGNTPFLWTLYGSGELPQCFCRLCAVFGGIYCLNRVTERVIFDEESKFVGIVSENKTLNAPLLLVEDSLNPSSTTKGGISRAILVTDKALVDSDAVSFLNFPSIDGKNQVHVVELPPCAMACPRGLFVIHLTSPQVSTAVEDLSHVIALLFNATGGDTTRPNILWSLHFNLLEFTSDENEPSKSNIYFGSGPNPELDFDSYVTRAKNMFLSMFPDQEFLPQVPDPEDVIIEDVPTADSSAAVEDKDAEKSQEIVQEADQVSENQL